MSWLHTDIWNHPGDYGLSSWCLRFKWLISIVLLQLAHPFLTYDQEKVKVMAKVKYSIC